MENATVSRPQDTGLAPVPCSQSRCRQLETEITELTAHLNAATSRLLELIREFDDAQGWSGPGMASCAHWLNPNIASVGGEPAGTHP